MSPFLRKVKTASGATAVQIVVKEGHKNRIIEHLGSAHDEAGLAVLMAAGRAKRGPTRSADAGLQRSDTHAACGGHWEQFRFVG